MKRSGNGGRRIVKSREAEEPERPVDLDEMFKEAEQASQKRDQEEAKKIEETAPQHKPKRAYVYKRHADPQKQQTPLQEEQKEKTEIPVPRNSSDSSDAESDDEEDLPEDHTEDTKTAQDHLRCQYRKAVEKGIRGDLTKLGIAPEVIDLADQYYFEVTKGEIKRSNLRKGIMFACVFQAYKDLGKHQTPDYLQNLFKITRRVMSKGLTYFYPRSNKRSGENGYITAEHFIPRIMETFNCKQEHIQAALRLYSQVKDKTTLFNSSNPQSVSSGLVYYYFKKINADIPGSTFGKAVGLSEITITRIASRIDEILSS